MASRSSRGTPSVGVIIPTYNAAGLVGEAVASVLAQDPPADQLVVVDDGSTDETASVLQRYAGRLEYVRQPNRGPAAARNTGLTRLETDTVVFLDADDLLLPGALEGRRGLLAQGDAMWAHTEGLLQDGSGRRRLFSETTATAAGLRREGWIFPDLLRRNFITMDAVIVRRDALRTVGGFDETIRGTEDWDLWLRLAVRYPVRYSPEPTFLYRLGTDTVSSDREGMDRARYQTLVKIGRLFPREVASAGPAARRSVADAYNGLGYLLAAERRWREARPYLRASVALWPWQRRAWWRLLRCLLHARRSPAGG